ncbi:ribosomal protein S18 acetylase RimI-like enzyme [Clostridium saccharoperbutylacetonicum]|uniref:Acetyltransferase family protein n=1 Tax=Clostridium saccharoperbutylacetonicum N1-4(HMT) TaxID=931276 RepID=M1MUF2_9CLOT|nr:GNAT family N-acetyltransferase [Clostridium saccharoperbutylacetonicum]AGF55172.1 acetyltransferase family protein [Clostridium saccharoperbutylacetonicum N1-4(HMT)]NRT64117.1 ribosomal protein S18 acetylase RimI-like enzyme [Clostridium saccharoperbutylacetonicum]NSB27484.1 ribosomal protein S18 acetylase RimI-like enzyme [Clostridium saccharoperbutylacetonicum]NSB40973.1 ribosomal protein S18 acetylase RimI-like enzyme [Clostridium saccharoperbutylacetonicum]
MGYKIQKTTENINWLKVSELLSYFGLSDLDAETQQKVFERSYAVVFLFEDEELIGFGRAISDGICQAAIYNIALDERYQGKGLGKKIIDELIEQVKQCNIILYTHPKTIEFYEKLGFSKMKTGMAMYNKDHLEELKNMGFI